MAAVIVVISSFLVLGRVTGNVIGCHDDEDCLALNNTQLWRCVVVHGSVTGSLPCTVDAGLWWHSSPSVLCCKRLSLTNQASIWLGIAFVDLKNAERGGNLRMDARACMRVVANTYGYSVGIFITINNTSLLCSPTQLSGTNLGQKAVPGWHCNSSKKKKKETKIRMFRMCIANFMNWIKTSI